MTRKKKTTFYVCRVDLGGGMTYRHCLSPKDYEQLRESCQPLRVKTEHGLVEMWLYQFKKETL